MKLVCLDRGSIIELEDKDPDGYVAAVAQDKEDFGERVKSPFGGVCSLLRIFLEIGCRVSIAIEGSVTTCFLVKDAEIAARGRPDELREKMPEEVRRIFEKFSLYSPIVYLVFKLPNGNHLWVENSFVALYE